MLVIPTDDAVLIDQYAPRTEITSPRVTQMDTPGQNLMSVGGVKVPELPDPAIGGKNGSGSLNGFSTGFRSIRSKLQPFLGAIILAPAMDNPVQGQVGNSSRATKTYMGVMNQLLQYVPSQAEYASSYVGTVRAQNIVVQGK
jgi:hypothetical protein